MGGNGGGVEGRGKSAMDCAMDCGTKVVGRGGVDGGWEVLGEG